MCGSISHSCGSEGHPVPLQGPQLQGNPASANRSTISTVFSLSSGCCSPVQKPPRALGSARTRFQLQQLWAFLPWPFQQDYFYFYLPVLCASPAGSLQLPPVHPSPARPRCRAAQPEQPCQKAPTAPSHSPQPLPAPLTQRAQRQALKCLPFPAR